MRTQPHRRFWTVIGPDAMDYDLVRATSPLEAVLQIQRDALGLRNVRCLGGQIVFKDAEMQRECAGEWRVVPSAQNGRKRLAHKIVIPAPERRRRLLALG
jgi:hypothetical protein